MTISKRKFLIGIISSILISIIHLLNGLFEYAGMLKEAYSTVNSLIYTISYSFFYISALFLLKNVLIDFYQQEFLRKNLAWIIKLNIVNSLLAVFVVLGFGKLLGLIIAILGIINLIFYIMFFRDVMSLAKSDVPTIEYLKNFIIALLIAIILLFGLKFIIEFGRKQELNYLNRVFIAVPFVFLSIFFYKTMKMTYKENVST